MFLTVESWDITLTFTQKQSQSTIHVQSSHFSPLYRKKQGVAIIPYESSDMISFKLPDAGK